MPRAAQATTWTVTRVHRRAGFARRTAAGGPYVFIHPSVGAGCAGPAAAGGNVDERGCTVARAFTRSESAPPCGATSPSP